MSKLTLKATTQTDGRLILEITGLEPGKAASRSFELDKESAPYLIGKVVDQLILLREHLQTATPTTDPSV